MAQHQIPLLLLLNVSRNVLYDSFLLPLLVSGVVHSPINVQLMAINSHSLIFSWDPPIQQSIPIIGYNYTCIGINVSYTITGSVSDTTFSVILLGLIPFSEYTCNVSTITNYGIGTSLPVSAVTKEAGIIYDHIIYS